MDTQIVLIFYLCNDLLIGLLHGEDRQSQLSDAIEDAFSNAMPTFESYTIEGNQLRIRYADGDFLERPDTDLSLNH